MVAWGTCAPLVVNGTWLQRCGGAEEVSAWKSRHPFDLAAIGGTTGLIYLQIPKAGSSSSRAVIDRLIHSTLPRNFSCPGGYCAYVSWSHALTTAGSASERSDARGRGRLTLTLTFSRDPVARFASAVGTILHRLNLTASAPHPSGAIHPRSLHPDLFGCLSSERVRLRGARAQLERRMRNLLCMLRHTERHGPYWDQHVAPQVAFLGTMPRACRVAALAGVGEAVTRRDTTEVEPAQPARLGRAATTVPQACARASPLYPSPVLVIPLRETANATEATQTIHDGWALAASLLATTRAHRSASLGSHFVGAAAASASAMSAGRLWASSLVQSGSGGQLNMHEGAMARGGGALHDHRMLLGLRPGIGPRIRKVGTSHSRANNTAPCSCTLPYLFPY